MKAMLKLACAVALPMSVLGACNSSGGGDGAQPAFNPPAATPAATGGASAGVSGFDLLDGHGDVTATWTAIGNGQWQIQNFGNGESGTVQEIGRSDCCITFQVTPEAVWSVDFNGMELNMAPGESDSRFTMDVSGVTRG